MSVFPFLDLPIELAERIMLSMDVPTVLRVMQTARFMHAFVCSSEEIQYKIQLYYHGYVDATRTTTSSYVDRRTQLDNFRDQWTVTEPTKNGRLYLYSTFYILEGGVFAMLDRSSNSFFITRSQGPSRGISSLSWKTPSLDLKILTFGMDPTVNLFAVLGMIEVDQRCVGHIRLLTLTGCTPYPLVAFPVLTYPGFPDCTRIRDSRSKILISGPWLGLTWREAFDNNWERLCIWNWKSGNVHLYIERVLAFSFISDKYLLTAHQDHLSVYNLSKGYPPFNRLDPSTEPIPVCRLALPGICHAAGLHRSGSLDHVPGSPFVLPQPDAADVLPLLNLTPDGDTSSDFDDEGTAWEAKEVPFHEDPSINILALNLIPYVDYWVAGTMGTTIIIPLQRLVDFAEETVAKSGVDTTGKAAKDAMKAQTEPRDRTEAQIHSGLGNVQLLGGVPRDYLIFKLAQLERQKRIELIKAGLSAETTDVHDSTRVPRNPRCFQASQWLKYALVFKQRTRGHLYDYRKSVVSGSRFVASIEVRERKGLFQLIEFNPTWVNALEKRLGRPARNVGLHYQTAGYGNPMFHPVERNWKTEGLIVPMTFEEHAAVTDHPGDSNEDSVDDFLDTHFGGNDGGYAFRPPRLPVTPTPTPILTPSPVESGTDLRLEEIYSPGPSWYGWRVARCGEVKYAWKVIQINGDIIPLDVAIQEDSLIYTAAEDHSMGANVYFAIDSF